MSFSGDKKDESKVKENLEDKEQQAKAIVEWKNDPWNKKKIEFLVESKANPNLIESNGRTL